MNIRSWVLCVSGLAACAPPASFPPPVDAAAADVPPARSPPGEVPAPLSAGPDNESPQKGESSLTLEHPELGTLELAALHCLVLGGTISEKVGDEQVQTLLWHVFLANHPMGDAGESASAKPEPQLQFSVAILGPEEPKPISGADRREPTAVPPMGRFVPNPNYGTPGKRQLLPNHITSITIKHKAGEEQTYKEMVYPEGQFEITAVSAGHLTGMVSLKANDWSASGAFDLDCAFEVESPSASVR